MNLIFNELNQISFKASKQIDDLIFTTTVLHYRVSFIPSEIVVRGPKMPKSGLVVLSVKSRFFFCKMLI